MSFLWDIIGYAISLFGYCLYSLIRIIINFKQSIVSPKNLSYETSCQVQNIVWKRKFFMIDAVCPQDFIAFHERYANPSYVLQPKVSLYCLTMEDAYFVETSELMDVYNLETNAFQYIGQFVHANKLIKMPLTSFYRLADDIGDPAVKVCFMPNTGRCGSTLLAKALANTPGTLVHAEPDCLTNLGDIWKSVTQAEYERLLVATVSFLCRPYKDMKRICIKTRVCGTCLIDSVNKHFPEFVFVYGYRNSLKTVSSFLGVMASETAISMAMYLMDNDTFSAYIPWFRRRFFYYFCYVLAGGNFTELADEMNTAEQFTYTWASCIAIIRNYQRQGGKLIPILYEDMIADKVGTLQKLFLELDIDKKHTGSALKAFAEDSQAGSTLSRENIQNLKRRRVSEESIRKANKILARFDLPNLGEEFRLSESSG